MAAWLLVALVAESLDIYSCYHRYGSLKKWAKQCFSFFRIFELGRLVVMSLYFVQYVEIVSIFAHRDFIVEPSRG